MKKLLLAAVAAATLTAPAWAGGKGCPTVATVMAMNRAIDEAQAEFSHEESQCEALITAGMQAQVAPCTERASAKLQEAMRNAFAICDTARKEADAAEAAAKAKADAEAAAAREKINAIADPTGYWAGFAKAIADAKAEVEAPRES